MSDKASDSHKTSHTVHTPSPENHLERPSYDLLLRMQKQVGNRYLQRLLATHQGRKPIQRTLRITGQNGGNPLVGIRSNAAFNLAVVHYEQGRTKIANYLENVAADNTAREPYATWDAAIDDAAMYALHEAVKSRDMASFNILLPKVRTLRTWEGSDERTDLLTFVKYLSMGSPADKNLKTMNRKITTRLGQVPAGVPVIASPLTAANQLPVSGEIYRGIATIADVNVKNILRMMIVLLNNFNGMAAGTAEAEKTHGVIHDIDDLIDQVNGYDTPTHSIIPLPLSLALQTLRDQITPLRNLLNVAVATHHNVARVGAGSRPDRHISYADLADIPGLLPNATARQAYNRQITQGGLDHDQNPAKTQEEGLSAAAASQQYPLLFNNMTAAPHRDDVVGNVEYYDNNGDPWDQKTAFRGPGTTASTAMNSVANSIVNQQLVQYPRRGSAVRAQVGVLLDTTYVNPREYEILWMMIFQRAKAGKITLAKLKEVRSGTIMATLPSLQLDTTDFDTGDANTSVARLDQLSTANPTQPVIGRDGVTRNFKVILQAPLLARDDHTHNIANTFNGTRDGYAVYSNGNGILPGGVRYLEYSVPTTFLTDSGNKARFIRASNGALYITGTHYEAWTNTGTNTAQIPFYKIV